MSGHLQTLLASPTARRIAADLLIVAAETARRVATDLLEAKARQVRG